VRISIHRCRRKKRNDMSLARSGPAKRHADAADRATGTAEVGHRLVDGLGPVEADVCRMVRVTQIGWQVAAVSTGKYAHPQHFAVTTERRVQSVGRDRLVQAVDAQPICRTDIVVVVVIVVVDSGCLACRRLAVNSRRFRQELFHLLVGQVLIDDQPQWFFFVVRRQRRGIRHCRRHVRPQFVFPTLV